MRIILGRHCQPKNTGNCWAVLYVYSIATMAFIIENIPAYNNEDYSWYDLIDRTSGRLKAPIEATITEASDGTIGALLNEIVGKRNRIIHSFQITDNNGRQKLATKDINHKQYIITKDYLSGFIKLNNKLSSSLHSFRGY